MGLPGAARNSTILIDDDPTSMPSAVPFLVNGALRTLLMTFCSCFGSGGIRSLYNGVMDALLITTDISVLHEGSAAEGAIQEYASLGKHIMVFVIASGKGSESARRIGSSIWIVPIKARFRIWAAY